MRRILCHSDLSQPKPGHPGDRLNITPNRHAARALGVPFFSLQELAKETIAQQQKPLSLTSPVRAYYQLRTVIRDIVNPQDLEGTTRTWMPTIQSLLSATPQLTLTETLSDRSKQLIQTAIAYQTALHQNHQFDFAELYWQAINALENTVQKRPLLIYGYFTPSPDEIAFINAIAGDNSLIYLPTGEEDLFSSQRHTIAILEQEGWQTVKSQTKPTALQSQFLSINPQNIVQEIQTSYQIYADQDIEARSILTQIKQLLSEGISAQEIVIVTAQDTLWGNLLLDMAWELGIALRLPYNIPLSETRLGAWFAHLIQVIDQGFPYELTRRLLHHPLSSFLKPENWQQIEGNPPKNLNQWQTILENTAVNLQDFPLPIKANRQAWLSTFQELLQHLQIRENAAYWAKESVAYQNLEKGLQTLAEPSQELIPWSQWRDELLSSLSILQTTAYPGREGVELHNANSIVGARYSHVFVLDMLEGKLPAAVKDDPILDFFERQQLQSEGIYLANAADLARQETTRFYQLLSLGTESITFSHSRMDRQGLSYSSAEPSSYLERLGLTANEVSLPIASLELARQQYLRHPQTSLDDPLLNQISEHLMIEHQRENQTLTEEFAQYNGGVGITVNLETHIFSASQLLQLGQCPFKWFANKILKLAELDELEEDLSPSLRGNLYHKVVEIALNYWQQDKTINLTEQSQLLQWFLEAEKQLNFPTLPAWLNRRQEHINTLKNTFQKADFLPEKSEVLKLEAKFTGEWQGLKITGRVDRLDDTPEGLVLIDYKTGGTAPKGVKNAEGEAKIDLQLQLYAAVAAPSLSPDRPVHKTLYYSLTKGEEISPKSFPSEAELIEVGDRLKTHLQTGNYPVEPDIKEEACRYCDYDVVCRKRSPIK